MTDIVNVLLFIVLVTVTEPFRSEEVLSEALMSNASFSIFTPSHEASDFTVHPPEHLTVTFWSELLEAAKEIDELDRENTNAPWLTLIFLTNDELSALYISTTALRLVASRLLEGLMVTVVVFPPSAPYPLVCDKPTHDGHSLTLQSPDETTLNISVLELTGSYEKLSCCVSNT